MVTCCISLIWNRPCTVLCHIQVTLLGLISGYGVTWFNCREVIWALYAWRRLSGIFESKSFCSVWYFYVKGKTLSLGGMLHMPDDWVSRHCDNSENSDEIRVITFMYRAKTISRNFSMTHGIAWKWQFPVLSWQFLSYTQENKLEFYFCICNHAWKWKFWVIIFCTILKTTTQNFSKPTKDFNLANIVQAFPVSFQTNRVNKDVSNSVKD